MTCGIQSRLWIFVLALMVSTSAGIASAAEKQPIVGASAKDFELNELSGDAVALSKEVAKSPVVLVVLRGWPGYQCPICTRQVSDFIAAADRFKAAGATLLFVYPGPADQLKEHAAEFVKSKDYPPFFHFLLDPDYTFTNAYGLRWDAAKETAYPSTFVIDENQKIVFAKISKTHGGRASVDEVIKAIPAK